jgi:arginine-tRNA-protein transferase
MLQESIVMSGVEPNLDQEQLDPPPPQTFSEFPALSPPRGLRLSVLPERPCPYLPARTAMDRAIWADSMPAELYEQFMNRGFRRSGRLLYQPLCPGCRECKPIRLAVRDFAPSKSQRRSWRRNLDLKVSMTAPHLTDEKFELYRRYVRQWHQRQDVDDSAGLKSFLYDSPLQTTVEFEYRDPRSRLIGVGICDQCPAVLSSVYFYFDPRHAARSLGTFSAMYEISFARQLGLLHYYLGYYVAGCRTMEYKRNFTPCEILCPDGLWRRL